MPEKEQRVLRQKWSAVRTVVLAGGTIGLVYMKFSLSPRIELMRPQQRCVDCYIHFVYDVFKACIELAPVGPEMVLSASSRARLSQFHQI